VREETWQINTSQVGRQRWRWWGIRRIWEKPIWAMSPISSAVNVNRLITDLHFHLNIDCNNRRGTANRKREREGRLQMRVKERQMKKYRRKADWESERKNKRGGSYSCLCHDVNGNEAGTVAVEQLLHRVYLKLLQHGGVQLLWGSWGTDGKIQKFSWGLLTQLHQL